MHVDNLPRENYLDPKRRDMLKPGTTVAVGSVFASSQSAIAQSKRQVLHITGIPPAARQDGAETDVLESEITGLRIIRNTVKTDG